MSNKNLKEKEAPETPREWRTQVKAHRLQDTTIHSTALASASKFEFEQFLLLRVLWKAHHPVEILPVAGMKGWVTQAAERLAQYKSWATYCESFGPQEDLPEGTFAIARYYQREAAMTESKSDPQAFHTPISSRTRAGVSGIGKGMARLSLGPPVTPTRKGRAPSPGPSAALDLDDALLLDDESSPSPTPSPSPIHLVTPVTRELGAVMYPPTKDEQIVNTALVVFLNALTIHFRLSSKWTLHRKAFIATFQNAKFEARTDGYLEGPGGNAKVIIEVKPVLRSLNLLPIQMQESAQMAAWIKSDSKVAQERNTTRFHVSQDRHFVYVTVARYGPKYLKYLVNGESSKHPSFLTMDQYGPWDTTDVGHMRQLGPILLAITLRAESQSQQEGTQEKCRDGGKAEGEEESEGESDGDNDKDSEEESDQETDETSDEDSDIDEDSDEEGK